MLWCCADHTDIIDIPKIITKCGLSLHADVFYCTKKGYICKVLGENI